MALLGLNFLMTQITMSAYYSLAAIGLCMLMGYSGQISMGQAGFFAIGAYTQAVLVTSNLIQYKDTPIVRFLRNIYVLIFGTDLYGKEVLHFSPWWAFLAAILITAMIALLMGLPLLKLKGHYLAMATLGFTIIIYKVVLGAKILGGADGITNLPAFELFPGVSVNSKFSDRLINYYIAWGLVVCGMFLLTNLINSRVGRALRSLHGSEEAACSMGVNLARYKLNIFILSSIFAAVAGIFLTHYTSGIGPSEAGIMKSIRYVAIVAIGGMDNLAGTLIMGTILNFLSLRGIFGTYDDAVFGAILILIMFFRPKDIFINQKVLGILKMVFNKRGNDL